MSKEGDRFRGRDDTWRELRTDPEGGHLRPYPSDEPGGDGPDSPKGGGCLGMVILIAGAVGATAWWLLA